MTISKNNAYVLSLITGGLSSLGFAPNFYWPLLILGISSLLFLINYSTNIKQAFIIGWFFGLGHFIVGISWIYHSLMVDAEKFAWLAPLVVFVLPAVLALYIAMVSMLTFLANKNSRLFIFAALWVIAEYLRGHLFSGFPWNLVGHAVAFSDQLMQGAAIFGVYGLSFIVITFASLPYFIFSKSPDKLRFSIIISLIFACNYYYGHLKLKQHTKFTNIAIRIIQPATKQVAHVDILEEKNNLYELIEMSTKDAKQDLKYVIWPENGFRFVTDDKLVSLIKTAAPLQGFLITSGIASEKLNYNQVNFYNVLHVFDRTGNQLAEYKKVHLVPFGEYVPLPKFFHLDKIVPGLSDFSSGKRAHNVNLGNVLEEFRPLICYEDIFADEVRVDNSAKWLVSLTNDAWFGNSYGPYQHFHISRFRAIEQGIPLIRATRTGISAIIDSYGRVIKKTSMQEKTVLDGYIPMPVSKSFYAKHEDNLIFVIISIIMLYYYLGIKEKYLKI